MEIVIKIVQFILSFSLLVVVHELGHFMFARLFKTRVDKFYLFFDPWFSLFKFKKGDTEYGIGWIPFGGYVKISGMVDESMDTEQLKQPVQPYEFRAKPAWQRLLIMVGGVVMNLVLALFIYIGISYAWGDSYISNDNVKYGYAFNQVAQDMGFKSGDKIVDVDGKRVNDALKTLETIVINQAEYVTVERDNNRLKIEIPSERISQMLSTPGFMTPRLPFVVNKVVKGGAADIAGLAAGDSLYSINGEPARYIDQVTPILLAHSGDSIKVSVLRDSAGMTKMLTFPLLVSQAGKVGVELTPYDKLLTISTSDYTILEAVPAGVARTGKELSSYAKQVKLIFSPETEAYKSLGGVISIGSIFPDYWSWEAFWKITALLSIVLAVMNILPIPALDGGHVLFLLYEVVSRRKPSDKFMEYAQITGVVILFALMIFATGNDIYRFFIK